MANETVTVTQVTPAVTVSAVAGHTLQAGGDINGPLNLIGALTVGQDDTGHDVKFYGATTGRFMHWDESADKLTISGDFDVTGTTTSFSSTVVKIADPIFTLGGTDPPGTDDNKDRGIEFHYHDGSSARVGFFGYDDSASAFTFLTAATNTSEVFSGTAGDLVAGGLTIGAGDVTNPALAFGSSSDGIYVQSNQLRFKTNGSLSWIMAGNQLICQGGGDSKITGVLNTSITIRGGTTDTIFNSTGVGIGTSPDELLHLSSATSHKPVLEIENTNADSTATYLRLHKNTASPGVNDGVGTIQFQSNNDQGSGRVYAQIAARIHDPVAATTTGELKFNTFVAGTDTTVMTLLDGNVGIGTVVPSESMHISDAANVQLKLQSSGAVSGIHMTNTTGDNHYFTSNGGALTIQADAHGSDGILLFYTGASERMRIAQTGLVSTTSSLIAATGNETALSVNYTVNKATSGNDTGFLVNQTDTASPGTSLLMDLQVGGTSKFSVKADGRVTATRIGCLDLLLEETSPGYHFTSSGFYLGTGASERYIGFGSTYYAGTPDVTLYRDAASILGLRVNGAAQEFRIYSDLGDPAGNFERGSFAMATNGDLTIATEKGGTGASGDIILLPDSGNVWVGANAWGLSKSGTEIKLTAFDNDGVVTLNAHGTNTAHLGFEVNNVEKMRVDTSGNVGIGTAVPTSLLTLVPPVNTPAIGSTGYSLTGSDATSLIDLAGTWNTTGTPTAIKLNVTNTASNAASRLIDLQAGGASKFYADVFGNAYFGNSWNFSTTGNVVGMSMHGTTGILVSAGSTYVAKFQANNLRFNSVASLSWTDGTSYNGTVDVNLYRDAAGILALRNDTNAQEFRVYETYTDASNYERGTIKFDSNFMVIGTDDLGTGTASGLKLQTDSTDRLTILAGGSVGIGTTNPIYGKLEIYDGSGGAATGLTIWADSGTTARIFMEDDVLNISRGSTPYISITSAGNTSFAGGMTYSGVQAVTASANLATTAYYCPVSSGGGAFTLTIPTAQHIVGRKIIVKDIDGYANSYNITIATESSQTIDGNATAVISTAKGYRELICTSSTTWHIIASDA